MHRRLQLHAPGAATPCVYGARGAHGALYERVGLEVDRRGGLVEDDEGGPHEQRAREAEQLALAVREVDAALRDGVVEAAHRVRHLHALQRHPQLLRTVPPLGVEVRADRAREQHGLLRGRTASGGVWSGRVEQVWLLQGRAAG